MAAATALGSAPFLGSCRRRRWSILLPTLTASVPRGRRINSHHSSIATVGKFAPSLLPRYAPPVAILHSIIDNGTSTASSRRRKSTQLICYCTEPEAQQNAASTTLEDDVIRGSANTLDLRVGRILKAWRHEEADSLYVEEVDVGEAVPRTICSGLVKYIPLHLLQDRNVIVLANLKPRNMRGVKSFGMLMAASDATHENVELLVPPEGAVPGDRVWFGSLDEKENLPDVASQNQVQKKKIWELIQPHLRTDDTCVATLGTKHHMRTSAGLITSQSLKNANIS